MRLPIGGGWGLALSQHLASIYQKGFCPWAAPFFYDTFRDHCEQLAHLGPGEETSANVCLLTEYKERFLISEAGQGCLEQARTIQAGNLRRQGYTHPVRSGKSFSSQSLTVFSIGSDEDSGRRGCNRCIFLGAEDHNKPGADSPQTTDIYPLTV